MSSSNRALFLISWYSPAVPAPVVLAQLDSFVLNWTGGDIFSYRGGGKEGGEGVKRKGRIYFQLHFGRGGCVFIKFGENRIIFVLAPTAFSVAQRTFAIMWVKSGVDYAEQQDRAMM
jgi:hypothetical protein